MLRVADVPQDALEALLARYGLLLCVQADAEAIIGSYWGDSEAGIVGHTVYARNDTPVHSLLHETCHVICMTSERRAGLHGDAGGDELEEAAVCYLQVVLAAQLPDMGSDRAMQDMDAWGYSFRLGSTRAWFEHDAEDARAWLTKHGLLAPDGGPTFQLRR